MKYHEIECVNACNVLVSKRLPYRYDLNIYRGCQHACMYCYARYTHQYLENRDFSEDIYVKVNIVERLEEMLKRPNWNHSVINLGGVSDSYQAAEAKYQLMPRILKLLIQYKTPCIICTKSDLILRDIDLINELSRITYVNIACTITANDESIRFTLEAGAISYQRRWQMLKTIKEKTNAVVGVHLMPIIPYLTDHPQQLESIYKSAKEIGADYILPGMLYLKGLTRPYFMNYINTTYPALYSPLNTLYSSKETKKRYQVDLYEYIHLLHKKYQITSNYNYLKEEKLKKPVQLKLDL